VLILVSLSALGKLEHCAPRGVSTDKKLLSGCYGNTPSQPTRRSAFIVDTVSERHGRSKHEDGAALRSGPETARDRSDKWKVKENDVGMSIVGANLRVRRRAKIFREE
jgi:hypothetical protein